MPLAKYDRRLLLYILLVTAVCYMSSLVLHVEDASKWSSHVFDMTLGALLALINGRPSETKEPNA